MTSFALFGATLAGLVRRLRLGLPLHATRSDRGTPVTPLSLTIPARKSATTCFSAAFSASRRSVRASRAPRDSSERGIFSGTDMLGTNRVRYEQGQPRSSSYLPGFLPQVHSTPSNSLICCGNVGSNRKVPAVVSVYVIVFC